MATMATTMKETLMQSWQGRFAVPWELDGDEQGTEKFFHAVIDGLIGHRSVVPDTATPRTRLNAPALRGLFELVAGHPTLFESGTSILPLLVHSEDTADVTARKIKFAELVLRTVQARRGELVAALQLQSMEICSHSFEDFDWSVRLIISSDKLSAIRVPVLLLTIIVRHHDESLSSSPPASSSSLQRAFAALSIHTVASSTALQHSTASPVTVELTRAQLDTLLSAFAAAQKVLDRAAGTSSSGSGSGSNGSN